MDRVKYTKTAEENFFLFKRSAVEYIWFYMCSARRVLFEQFERVDVAQMENYFS